jgi:O-antigen ligase
LAFSIAVRRKQDVDWTSCVFLAFWLYLFLNACFIGEWQAVRRLLVLLVFSYTMHSVLNNFFVFRVLISLVVCFVTFCALFSLCSLGISGELDFSHRATRIDGSGIENFADFGNTIDAGTRYMPVLAFSIWLALTAKKRIAIIGWSLCAFPIAIFLYFTWARTVWLASVTSLIVLMSFLSSKHAKRAAFWVAVVAAVFLLVFKSQLVFLETVGRGLSQRDVIWSNVIERMPDHWLVGYGGGAAPGAFHLSDGFVVHHVHNLYLEILYQYGLTGVILMLSASIACLVRLYCLRRNPLAVLWLAILSGGLLAMCFAMSNFVGPPNRIWIYYWLPVAGCLATSLKRYPDMKTSNESL